MDGNLTLELRPPNGPIHRKYYDFVHNEDFPEMAFIGEVATGKSHAEIDAMALSAFEYPGSNILLVRGKLSDLKRSTLSVFTRRVGLLFESENNNEAVFKFPFEPHPVTGQPVQSVVRAIGLDRSNIENTMKSTEWFRVFPEEGNEIESKHHDLVQMRARQVVYSKTRKVKDLIAKKARLWEIPFELAHEIYINYMPNPLGKSFWKDLYNPMPGQNYVKTVFNPEGNDHTWIRYVGKPYPKEGVTPVWVKENIGIREVIRDYKERKTVKYFMMAGDIAETETGERHYVKYQDKKTREVHTIDGKVLPDSQTSLVLQRGCVYAFGDENESKNPENVRNSLFMVNADMRERAFAGIVNIKQGLVFQNFIAESAKRGGHILPRPKNGLPYGLKGIAGVDYGGNHAHAVSFGVISPKSSRNAGAVIVFGEYVKSGVSARAAAADVIEIPPTSIEMTWGGDPAMWAKEYASDDMVSPAERYEETGIVLERGGRGDIAFEDVDDALSFTDGLIDEKRMASFYVFEDCEMTIHVLSSLKWEWVRFERARWEVDLGDAIKIMYSMKARSQAFDVNLEAPRPKTLIKTKLETQERRRMGVSGRVNGYDS